MTKETVQKKAKTAKHVAKVELTETEGGLLTIASAFPVILQALRQVNNNDTSSTRYKRQIVCRLVELFAQLLYEMDHTFLEAVKKAIELGSRKVHFDKNGRPNKKSSEASSKIVESAQRLAQDIATILVSMFATLDTTIPDHAELLEGYLYNFMTHTGSILGSLVFNTSQQGTEQPEPAASAQHHFDGATAFETNSTEFVIKKAAENQAIYLIWILQRISTLIPGAKCSLSGLTKKPQQKRTGLSGQAVTKLQSTLLRGVFGMECQDFGDVLRVPTMPGGIDNGEILPKAPVDDVSEWFTKELWAVVGWEILEEQFRGLR